MLSGRKKSPTFYKPGKKNSFTWNAMKKGLEMQYPLFDSLRTDNKIRIETLEQSGLWFKENFPVTPATAFTTMKDIRNEGRKTVWFNNRFFRVNLLWENNSFRFRDIHLFDERFESEYLKKAGVGNQFFYYTLPVVDGFMWSTNEDCAGLRIMRKDANGNTSEILLDNPVVTEPAEDILQVACTDNNGNQFILLFRENQFEVTCKSKEKGLEWLLELTTAPGAELPFQSVGNNTIKAQFRGFDYSIICKKGMAVSGETSSGYVFSLAPEKNELVIDCTNP